MDPSAASRWSWVSLSPLPAWALWGVGLVLLLGVALAAWGVRREASGRRKAWLWALRAVAGACALFFVAEPGLREVQVARVRSRVAVLVDRSASMAFPVKPGAPSRSVAAAEAVQRLQAHFDALSERYALDVLGFDPELAPLGPGQLRGAPPVSGKTDLLTALRNLQAGEASASRKLAGVVLLSDGADNAELAQGGVARARSVLSGLHVPVNTVAVGEGGLEDLAVDAVKVDDFAFVRNSVTAEVEVHARGFKGQVVPVVLRREGRTIATKTVTFSSDDDAQTVPFTFSPDQTGRFVYTVAMPVFPRETVAENNTRSFALKVIRDRVRVLLVSGRPTWDERFLRGLLKQDANVELISFYILRNSTDDTGTFSESELSLIPFPQNEIFHEKIDTFDLIIMVNFGNDERGIGVEAYEPDIRRYVQNGGALAFLGGDRCFGEGSGVRNPFAEVLPLEAAGPADVAPFKPRLTAEGQRHPITALGSGGLTQEAAWEGLPPVPGINLTRARPGATVLLEHPFTMVGGHNAPLLAIWEHGRGRVMAIATDGTWHWALPAHATGAPTRTWEKLWGNAIRWLVKDPDLTALSLVADPPAVEPGKPVGASAVVRLPDYSPAAGASLTVELVSAEDGQVIGSQQVVAAADGAAHVEFPPPPPGAYKLVARAAGPTGPLGEASDAVAVRSVGPELSDARVNHGLLDDLAQASGGRSFASPSFDPGDLKLDEPPLVEVGRSKDQPVWDRWYWLALAVAVTGLEWALRRRFGYV